MADMVAAAVVQVVIEQTMAAQKLLLQQDKLTQLQLVTVVLK
jgi:hypothetical protein